MRRYLKGLPPWGKVFVTVGNRRMRGSCVQILLEENGFRR